MINKNYLVLYSLSKMYAIFIPLSIKLIFTVCQNVENLDLKTALKMFMIDNNILKFLQ